MATNAASFPPEILTGLCLCWATLDERFSDRDAFNAEVRELQDEDDDEWNPSEVFPFPKIRVSYVGVTDSEDEESPYTEFVEELPSDNGSSFTALELLFKLHNAVVYRLRDAHDCYFEGLILKDEGNCGESPLYEMTLGS